MEDTRPEKKRCVNCTKCTSQNCTPTVYVSDKCQYSGGCDNEATVSTKDEPRFQNADCKVPDPDATSDMIERIESKLIEMDPTNPLRGRLEQHEIIDENGATKHHTSAMWGAIYKFSDKKEDLEIYQDNVSKFANNSEKLGLVRTSHIENLSKCYDEEEVEDNTDGAIKKFPRFLHINTGSHGDKNGKTVESHINAVLSEDEKRRVEKYLKDCEEFIKFDLQTVWVKDRTSVFMINSRCIPLYPVDKDCVDTWCMSQRLQKERIKLSIEQSEIASHLKKDAPPLPEKPSTSAELGKRTSAGNDIGVQGYFLAGVVCVVAFLTYLCFCK